MKQLVGFVYVTAPAGDDVKITVASTATDETPGPFQLVKIGRASVSYTASEAVPDDQWTSGKNIKTNLWKRYNLGHRLSKEKGFEEVVAIPIFSEAQPALISTKASWRNWTATVLDPIEKRVLNQQILGTVFDHSSLSGNFDVEYPFTELRVCDQETLLVLGKCCAEMTSQVDPMLQWDCFAELLRKIQISTRKMNNACFTIHMLGKAVECCGALFCSPGQGTDQLEEAFAEVVKHWVRETEALAKHLTTFHYLDVERSKKRPNLRAEHCPAEQTTPPGGTRQRERSSTTPRAPPRARKSHPFDDDDDDDDDDARPAGSKRQEAPAAAAFFTTTADRALLGEKTRAMNATMTTTTTTRPTTPRKQSKMKATTLPQPEVKNEEGEGKRKRKRKREDDEGLEEEEEEEKAIELTSARRGKKKKKKKKGSATTALPSTSPSSAALAAPSLSSRNGHPNHHGALNRTESEPPCMGSTHKPKATKVVSGEPTREEQPGVVGRSRSTDSVTTRQEAPADHAPGEKTRATSTTTTTPSPRKRSKTKATKFPQQNDSLTTRQEAPADHRPGEKARATSTATTTPPPREQSKTKATGSPQPGAKKNEERHTQTRKRKREVLPGHFKRKQKADAAEATTPVAGLGTPDNKLTNAALEHNRELAAIVSRALPLVLQRPTAVVPALRPEHNPSQMRGVAFGRPTVSGPTSVDKPGNGATGRVHASIQFPHASTHSHDAVASVDRPLQSPRPRPQLRLRNEPAKPTPVEVLSPPPLPVRVRVGDRLLSFAPEDVAFLCRVVPASKRSKWYQM